MGPFVPIGAEQASRKLCRLIRGPNENSCLCKTLCLQCSQLVPVFVAFSAQNAQLHTNLALIQRGQAHGCERLSSALPPERWHPERGGWGWFPRMLLAVARAVLRPLASMTARDKRCPPRAHFLFHGAAVIHTPERECAACAAALRRQCAEAASAPRQATQGIPKGAHDCQCNACILGITAGERTPLSDRRMSCGKHFAPQFNSQRERQRGTGARKLPPLLCRTIHAR